MKQEHGFNLLAGDLSPIVARNPGASLPESRARHHQQCPSSTRGLSD
jgi:hypothetical protein